MNVLLVEDDDRTAGFIEKGFRREGHDVERAADGAAGLALALERPHDLLVVDLMLPKIDGLELIDRLRGSGLETPILILSAKSSVDDRVTGLRSGSDDYLVKPFVFSELLARSEALFRRSRKIVERMDLSVGDLQVDVLKRKVHRAGKEIPLQPLEFSLLEYLVRNRGRVVSKTMIMEHVWEYHFDPQTNVVEVCVCRLREKIDKPFETKLIHTVRGCGYVLDVR